MPSTSPSAPLKAFPNRCHTPNGQGTCYPHGDHVGYRSGYGGEGSGSCWDPPCNNPSHGKTSANNLNEISLQTINQYDGRRAVTSVGGESQGSGKEVLDSGGEEGCGCHSGEEATCGVEEGYACGHPWGYARDLMAEGCESGVLEEGFCPDRFLYQNCSQSEQPRSCPHGQHTQLLTRAHSSCAMGLGLGPLLPCQLSRTG